MLSLVRWPGRCKTNVFRTRRGRAGYTLDGAEQEQSTLICAHNCHFRHQLSLETAPRWDYSRYVHYVILDL
jgi:hypothetical protein